MGLKIRGFRAKAFGDKKKQNEKQAVVGMFYKPLRETSPPIAKAATYESKTTHEVSSLSSKKANYQAIIPEPKSSDSTIKLKKPAPKKPATTFAPVNTQNSSILETIPSKPKSPTTPKGILKQRTYNDEETEQQVKQTNLNETNSESTILNRNSIEESNKDLSYATTIAVTPDMAVSISSSRIYKERIKKISFNIPDDTSQGDAVNNEDMIDYEKSIDKLIEVEMQPAMDDTPAVLIDKSSINFSSSIGAPTVTEDSSDESDTESEDEKEPRLLSSLNNSGSNRAYTSQAASIFFDGSDPEPISRYRNDDEEDDDSLSNSSQNSA